MGICVKSEVGQLKKVMLHRPGKELERLVPHTLERLLFDDIPYLKKAREEHDCFANILRDNGVEVVYLEDLMAAVLTIHPELKKPFIEEFVSEAGSKAVFFKEQVIEYLYQIEDERNLVLKTMSGISYEELKSFIKSGKHQPLVELVKPERRFILDPIPNLYFTRDPFASIGRGFSLHHMYSHTRQRETLYGKYILSRHPDMAEAAPLFYDRDYPYSVEGGDILNLSEKVLAVGLSQRTTPEGVELLARQLFSHEGSEIKKVLALDIPDIRAFMHLDTVFTQVDTHTFLIHPGILPTLRVYEISGGDRTGSLHVRENTLPLEEILAAAMEKDSVKLIRCGGDDRIAAEREQWNDGSNTLCIAPGKVIAYDRNDITNEILKEQGIQVLEMPSSELSRGRGGPRCMSMPLVREPV